MPSLWWISFEVEVRRFLKYSRIPGKIRAMTSAEPIIRLEEVTKDFDNDYAADEERLALDHVSFTVPEGAFLFVTGPSGAGKSTLVRLLYAELRPTTGVMYVCGHDIARMKRSKLVELRREVGVVHQDFHLIGRKTALDNVALALEVAGVRRREALERAEEALDQVRLTHHRHTAAIALSGGEKQRVALARALVVRPRLIVADEPTGNLDPELSDEVFSILDRVNARGTSVLVATHDRSRIDRAGKPVLFLQSGRVAGTRGFAGDRR